MVAIKSGLLAAALGLFSTILQQSSRKPEFLFFENPACIGSLLVLNSDSYDISCNNNNFSHYRHVGDRLDMGVVVYYDNNSDGNIDLYYENGRFFHESNPLMNERYRQLLLQLKNEQANEIWERWRR